MAETSIAWTETVGPNGEKVGGYTFNPWLGCHKISAACKHCYAESWAKRFQRPNLWRGERQRTSVAYWRKPLQWAAEARVNGTRPRVFCASLADVFEVVDDETLSAQMDQWKRDLWDLIRQTPELDWLLLTKRPQNVQRWRDDIDLPNVWLGVTVESQEEAEKRIPRLVLLPGAVHFISAEPLLGPLDLTRIRTPRGSYLNAFTLDISTASGEIFAGPPAGANPVSWVICGGESGSWDRPSHPDWFRSLREQCKQFRAAFFFKQWGEWHPETDETTHAPQVWLLPDGTRGQKGAPGAAFMAQRPTRLTAPLLDGQRYNESPRRNQ
jgi:protein gp37